MAHKIPIKILKHAGAFLVFFLCSPAPSWALQSHGAPEGLYVHQMAHFFFAGALVYFFWDIKRSEFTGRGWRYLQLFCVFMILWNVLAFVGHATGLLLQKNDFFSDRGYWLSQIIGPLTPVKVTYYLAKLDHLICVPAIFFLFLSLRTFYNEERRRNGV